MIKFTIKNDRLTIDERILMIESFHNIWEYYKKKKEAATQMLLYVYLMNDITQENPMLDVPDYDKEEACKRHAFRTSKKLNAAEQELYDAAAKDYKALTEDSVVRLGRVVHDKVEQISNYLRSFSNVDKDNVETQFDNINKIEKLLSTKNKIDDQIERHTAKVKAKGDRFRSPLEKGKIKYVPTGKRK